MKRLPSLFLFIALAGMILSLNSCFTICAAIVNKSKNRYKPAPEEIGIHEGWYKPKKENIDVQLSLTNNTLVPGRYKGIKVFQFEGGMTELVLVTDNQGKNHQFNVEYILRTEILPHKRKMSKGAVIGIGVALDIAVLVIAVSTADFCLFGDCFLDPDCN